MNSEDQLIEWTITYVKYRDLMTKNLLDYKILKNFIEFEFKKGKHIYYLYDELTNDSLKEIKNEGLVNFVVSNKKKNVKFLVDNWDEIIKNPTLKVIFVNPKINQHWIITPAIHNKIAERKKLKSGLMGLFENVKEV